MSDGGVQRVAGRTVCKVFLLDNSMKTILVDEDATAATVVASVCTKLGLRDAEVEAPLADPTNIVPVMEAWPEGDTAKFVFTIKLFMESGMSSTDPKVVYLHYIQAVYNVICGIYPTSLDECVSLAALQVQAKFGDHRADVHKPGYLSHQLKGLVPAALLPRKAPSSWESDVLARHALLTAEARANPQYIYTTVLKARDYYGCSFHPVNQTFSTVLPKQLLIGVSARGIFLLRHEDKTTLAKYSLAEIYRWGFKPGKSMYFEVKQPGGGGPVYSFGTLLGNHISDHLTDYAMMLLREMGLKADADAAAAAAAEPAAPTAGAGAAAAPLSADAKAAVRIQALYKGYLLRSELHHQFAATRIQAIARGFLARCRFDRMLEEMEAELEA